MLQHTTLLTESQDGTKTLEHQTKGALCALVDNFGLCLIIGHERTAITQPCQHIGYSA